MAEPSKGTIAINVGELNNSLNVDIVKGSNPSSQMATVSKTTNVGKVILEILGAVIAGAVFTVSTLAVMGSLSVVATALSPALLMLGLVVSAVAITCFIIYYGFKLGEAIYRCCKKDNLSVSLPASRPTITIATQTDRKTADASVSTETPRNTLLTSSAVVASLNSKPAGEDVKGIVSDLVSSIVTKVASEQTLFQERCIFIAEALKLRAKVNLENSENQDDTMKTLVSINNLLSQVTEKEFEARKEALLAFSNLNTLKLAFEKHLDEAFDKALQQSRYSGNRSEVTKLRNQLTAICETSLKHPMSIPGVPNGASQYAAKYPKEFQALISSVNASFEKKLKKNPIAFTSATESIEKETPNLARKAPKQTSIFYIIPSKDDLLDFAASFVVGEDKLSNLFRSKIVPVLFHKVISDFIVLLQNDVKVGHISYTRRIELLKKTLLDRFSNISKEIEAEEQFFKDAKARENSDHTEQCTARSEKDIRIAQFKLDEHEKKQILSVGNQKIQGIFSSPKFVSRLQIYLDHCILEGIVAKFVAKSSPWLLQAFEEVAAHLEIEVLSGKVKDYKKALREQLESKIKTSSQKKDADSKLLDTLLKDKEFENALENLFERCSLISVVSKFLDGQSINGRLTSMVFEVLSREEQQIIKGIIKDPSGLEVSVEKAIEPDPRFKEKEDKIEKIKTFKELSELMPQIVERKDSLKNLIEGVPEYITKENEQVEYIKTQMKKRVEIEKKLDVDANKKLVKKLFQDELFLRGVWKHIENLMGKKAWTYRCANLLVEQTKKQLVNTTELDPLQKIKDSLVEADNRLSEAHQDDMSTSFVTDGDIKNVRKVIQTQIIDVSARIQKILDIKLALKAASEAAAKRELPDNVVAFNEAFKKYDIKLLECLSKPKDQQKDLYEELYSLADSCDPGDTDGFEDRENNQLDAVGKEKGILRNLKGEDANDEEHANLLESFKKRCEVESGLTLLSEAEMAAARNLN